MRHILWGHSFSLSVIQMGRTMRESSHKNPVTFIWESVLLINLSASRGNLIFVVKVFGYFCEFLSLLIGYWISWILLDHSHLVPFTVAPNAPFSCKLFVPSPRPRLIFLSRHHCHSFSQRNSARGHCLPNLHYLLYTAKNVKIKSSLWKFLAM